MSGGCWQDVVNPGVCNGTGQAFFFFLVLDLKLDGMRISELLYIVLNSLLHFFKLHLRGVDRGF